MLYNSSERWLECLESLVKHVLSRVEMVKEGARGHVITKRELTEVFHVGAARIVPGCVTL